MIREEHYEPAVVAGMAAHRTEVEAIAVDPEPPTVENTLEALERAGQLLDRASRAFHNKLSADSTPGTRRSDRASRATLRGDAAPAVRRGA
ncbi:hypothetical protein APR04_005567 [Promicromonospora umidemergens]|uniref:Uncharacterized protein n=1 Tax=Promicromonospora umidemergens TaxID=629679 RepID=A0ABP8YDF5_9MICO|nr:hypothetical protein [Promicromonospora umidemergens]MCP2286627.1 hypothetical protein [Promicromonospora umidemergens]